MTADGSDHRAKLGDLTILLVEDEAIISFLLEDMLTELGCRDVRPVGGIAEALTAISERLPDVAVLDVNLAGEEVFPVAQKLKSFGVPFIFTTGYGRDGLPTAWADVPVIQKPFRADTLAAALADVVDGARQGQARELRASDPPADDPPGRI
jgi:DNA-binding NtrC family response regulator